MGQNWFGIARLGTPLQQTAVQRSPLPRWPQLSRVAWARENVSVFQVINRRCPATLRRRKHRTFSIATGRFWTLYAPIGNYTEKEEFPVKHIHSTASIASLCRCTSSICYVVGFKHTIGRRRGLFLGYTSCWKKQLCALYAENNADNIMFTGSKSSFPLSCTRLCLTEFVGSFPRFLNLATHTCTSSSSFFLETSKQSSAHLKDAFHTNTPQKKTYPGNTLYIISGRAEYSVSQFDCKVSLNTSNIQRSMFLEMAAS